MGDLGDLLKTGFAHAKAHAKADPQAERPAYITTYIAGPSGLPRPMMCGRPYTSQYGAKGVCMRDVERLANGLPTGRCSECREREMTAVEHRRHELAMQAKAEQNAKKYDGAKRRTEFDR